MPLRSEIAELIVMVPGTPNAEEALITLSGELRSKPATMVMLPPFPPKALARIWLPLWRMTNCGSIVMLPPFPAPVPTDVVMLLLIN